MQRARAPAHGRPKQGRAASNRRAVVGSALASVDEEALAQQCAPTLAEARSVRPSASADACDRHDMCCDRHYMCCDRHYIYVCVLIGIMCVAIGIIFVALGIIFVVIGLARLSAYPCFVRVASESRPRMVPSSQALFELFARAAPSSDATTCSREAAEATPFCRNEAHLACSMQQRLASYPVGLLMHLH